MSKLVTVSELTRYLSNLIAGDAALRSIAVTGEISNFKCYASGHCYFNLKDKGAIIPCVMFKGNAQRMRFNPKDGMQVIAAGSVNVYADGGRYQLYVYNMSPDGIGDLAAAFEQLKEKLTAEGLFDAAHKQSLPVYPKTIGIVTSSSGAVLRDIYRVSKRRFPAVQLILKPVQVQGNGAAEQIAAALDFFNAKYPVDVLIVGRGGGSLEDLWAFNEEAVVKAIFRSKIPVISAVGHETDFTLADFVADQRAATPSQAAELAVRDIREINAQLMGINTRLRNSVKRQLDMHRGKLQGLMNRQVLMQPKSMLNMRYQRIDMLRERLGQSTLRQLAARRQKIAHLLEKLELVNPAGVLRRGYSLTQASNGKVVSSIKDIAIDKNIRIQVSDGAFQACVTSIEEV